MTDIAIRVENLSKLYKIGVRQERYNTLRDTLTNAFTAPFRLTNHEFSYNKMSNNDNEHLIQAASEVTRVGFIRKIEGLCRLHNVM